MTDEQITLAAREICAAQAQKQDNDDGTRYLVGYYDHTVWMRLVEQGIRRGLEWQTMVKTQHCPNCEATEQKLHDFRQEVSDMITDILSKDGAVFTNYIGRFIIPKPKPDPLEYKHKVLRRIELRQPHTDALKIAREALEAFIDRFDSNWRTDTDYVAHLVRKALAALEQIK